MLMLMLPLATVGVAGCQLLVASCQLPVATVAGGPAKSFGRKHRQICTKWRHGTRIIIINIVIIVFWPFSRLC